MNENKKKRKWTWELTEVINPMLSEGEISDLVNRKLAYIILELEHNPINYIKVDKVTDSTL